MTNKKDKEFSYFILNPKYDLNNKFIKNGEKIEKSKIKKIKEKKDYAENYTKEMAKTFKNKVLNTVNREGSRNIEKSIDKYTS